MVNDPRAERRCHSESRPSTHQPSFISRRLATTARTLRRRLREEDTRSAGVLRSGAGDGRIAMVDVRDVAAVAARLLAGEVDRQGEALDLTGPEALGYTEVALRLGRALGQDVVYESQDAAAARALVEGIGIPDWRVEILLQYDQAFSEGRAARLSDVVEQVLERKPRSLDGYLEDALRECEAR